MGGLLVRGPRHLTRLRLDHARHPAIRQSHALPRGVAGQALARQGTAWPGLARQGWAPISMGALFHAQGPESLARG